MSAKTSKLNITLLWIIRLIPGLFLINWTPWFFPGEPEGRVALTKPAIKQVELAADERVLLLKQYENAVAEIRLRLEHEHLLFLVSFTIAGAVLAFGLRTYFFKGTRAPQGATADEEIKRRRSETVVLLGCWGAVVVTGIIDLRRQYNADIIVQLGTWIQSVEGKLYPPTVHGWETFIANDSPLWKGNLYPLLRFEREAMIWILYVVALQVFSIGDHPAAVKQASFFGMQISLLIFALIAVHYNYNLWLNSILCGVCWVLAVSVSILWYRGTQKHEDEDLVAPNLPLGETKGK
jgi:hypothetical protein